MKMKFLLAASALLLCLACAREELGTDDRIAGGSNNASEMIFSAVSPSTKTMMGESVEGKRPVYWSEGDKICVNGVVSDPLEGVSENATAVVFRVGSGLDAPFKGLYPASFYTDASTITLPSVQTWENGSFANGSFPMASYTQDQREEMAFRFLCSMLKLSIKQDSTQDTEADEIASVVFRGNDGEQVSGAFTIDYQNATLASTSSSDNDKIVGMIVNQPLSADKALDIYLVVPARVYDAGFTLSITDAQGRVMKKASNKSQTLKAGIIAKLPEFVFVPNAEGGDDPIPEDLIPKDGDVTEDGEPVVMYFGARIDNGEGDKEGTKTHLGTPSDGKYPNLWTVGDKVAINGVASASLPEANISNEGKRARFPMAQRVDKCAGYYYVGYPYTDGTTSGFTGFSDGAGTVVIPTEQAYTAGTYDPRAFVLIGKSTTQVMTFTPKMALLRVTPTDSDTPYAYNISKVRLESIAGEAMSGTFTTNFEDSFEASSGVSYIEISAPTDDGLDFGTPFFFMIPAQTYTKGLRFIVYTKDGKSMTFSNGSSYTASYGSSRSISSPKYTPSVSGSVSCDFLTSSSAGFSWSGGNASNNVKKPWRLAIYNDEECSSLKVAYNISETGEADKEVWYEQDGTPHYIVGGLTPGTTYYCQVTDVNNNIAMEPISFTTDSFTPVAAASPSGDVLLAENFGEFGHGTAWLGGYAGHRYAGWSPRSTSPNNNSVNCAAPTGEVTTGVSLPHDIQLRMVEGFDFTTAPRFNAGWGFAEDKVVADADTSVYQQPGVIRLGKKNADRVFLVLPALSSITSGKFATVDVEIRASHAVASDANPANGSSQFAVFLESGSDLTCFSTKRRLYSGQTLTRAYPFTVSTYGYSSETNTIRIDGVQNTDHLMIGAYANVEDRNRVQILSVKVTKVSESNVETFDITDDVSLRTFYARVDGGEKSLNAKVLADVTASSTTASAWTPLGTPKGTDEGTAPYTGFFEGNNKTITGLTSAFFNDVTGTVQNLALYSTIDMTTDAYEGPAIFANYLMGSGVLKNCTSKGSVRYCPSAAVTSATRYVAGLVCWVKSGTVYQCSNEASVTVPHNDQTNKMIVNVGGVMGTINDSGITITGPIQNSGNISVGITNSTSAAGGTSFYPKVGGVIGYAKGTSSLILDGLVNRGPVEYNGSSYSDVYVGGIAGHSYWRIRNSTNYATVTGSGSSTGGSYYYLGGICGYLQKDVQNVNNINEENATVTYTGNTSGAVAVVGGLHGYTTGTVMGGSNKAQVKYLGHSGNDFCVGGIVGRTHTGKTGTRVDGVTNYGKVTIAESSAHTGMDAFVGGVVGHHQSGNIMAYNQGAIEITDLECVTLEAGGLAGCLSNSAGITSGAKNFASGDISISGVTTSHDINAGGLAGYSTGSITGTNEGDVTIESSTVERSIYAAGISAEATASMSSCISSGKVEINSTVAATDTVFMGGVVGASRAISHTSCYNTGNLTNAAGGRYILIGGVSGFAKNSSWTSCSHRSNTISNTHAADSLICVGGVVGCSLRNSGTVSFTTCYNTGSVSNSGTVHLSSKGVEDRHACVGGLIGRATGVNSLVSTKAAYNYNKGPVSDSSSSDNIDLGGICGFADNASDFTFCRNLAEGIVTVGAGSPRNVYVSGILGIADGDDSAVILTSAINNGAINVSGTTINNILAGGGVLAQACGPFPTISGSSTDHTTNTGNITFTSSTIKSALRLGGVWGWRDNENSGTIEYCTNTGSIVAESGGLVTSYGSFNFVGGVIGGGSGSNNAAVNMTVQNCYNSASRIYMNFKGRLNMGGIIGSVQTAPVHCSNTANISLKRGSYSSTNVSYIGGIAGYQVTGTRNFVDLHHNGTIHTNETNYCYASGIIGYTNGNCTYDACSVEGSISCLDHNPGLFYSTPDGTTKTITFKNSCTVKSGTTLIRSSSTTTISAVADFTATRVIGGGGSSTSPTYANLSVN